MKRRVEHYEYVCDGMTTTGTKCPEQIIITAYDAADADYRVSQVRSDWTGLRWAHTSRGWLCTNPHRDESRLPT